MAQTPPASTQDQLLWTSLGGNNADKIGGNGHLYQYRQAQADGTVKTTTVLVDLGSLFSNRDDTGYDTLLCDARRYLEKFKAADAASPGPEFKMSGDEWSEALTAKRNGKFDNNAYRKLKAGDAEKARLQREAGPAVKDDSHQVEALAEALFVTHGHMDHIGAIPHYLSMGFKLPPIYCTALTREMIKSTLAASRVPNTLWPQFRTIAADDSVTVGPMRFQGLAVAHSIPQSLAFIIDSKAARHLHSGDFKADPTVRIGPPTDIGALTAAGIQGIDTMMVDSTKANTPGSLATERQIENRLVEVANANADKRLVVAVMGTSLERIVGLSVAAALSKRTVVTYGAAIETSLRALSNAGVDIKGVVSRAVAERGLNPADYPCRIVSGKSVAAEQLAPEQILGLATGTQGEPDAAMSKAANGQHKTLEIDPGQDVIFFSASVIPGNESPFSKLRETLEKRGFTVTTPREDPLLHASGHGPQADIALLLRAAKPAFVLPVHGDAKQLEGHRQFIESLGMKAVVVPNGVALSLQKGQAPAPAGFVKESWVGVLDETPKGEYRYKRFSYGEYPGGKPIDTLRKPAPQKRPPQYGGARPG